MSGFSFLLVTAGIGWLRTDDAVIRAGKLGMKL